MDTSTQWFGGRQAALGTKHGKEAVIAPLVRAELGIEIVLPADFDSDQFGTFTRDIPRAGTQIEAARQKAIAAMDCLGLDLGLASEGSFGAHPANPFAQGNVELIVLIDRAAGLEIHGMHIATDIRCGQTWIASADEAVAFAMEAGFPDHGVVVRRGPDDPGGLIKDLETESTLRAAVETMLASSAAGRVFIESDLRAHRNPVRMQAIRAATLDLIAKAQSGCPSCGTPGFRVVANRPGLPCRWCGSPTERTLALVYGCQRCGHQIEVMAPDGRTEAEPGECPRCNP